MATTKFEIAQNLEMLESLDHYKVLADEEELKWFYDHCVFPLKRNEAYAFCLSLRKKKLNEEDLKSPLGRVEMLDPQVVLTDKDGHTSYERFRKGVRMYECHKEAYIFGGRTLPAKGMVCYFHINPCDELKVIKDLKGYINIHEQELIDSAMRDVERANEIANIGNDLRSFCDAEPSLTAIDHMEKRIKALKCKTNESGTAQSLYKMCKSLSKMKRLQFDNVGTKYWVDFDMDLNDEGLLFREVIEKMWYDFCLNKLGKGNFAMVETNGGYHTIVKTDVIHWNPNNFIMEFLCTEVPNPKGKILARTPSGLIKELEYNNNAMIPVPGTYQYGFVVRVVNKGDFE